MTSAITRTHMRFRSAAIRVMTGAIDARLRTVKSRFYESRISRTRRQCVCWLINSLVPSASVHRHCRGLQCFSRRDFWTRIGLRFLSLRLPLHLPPLPFPFPFPEAVRQELLALPALFHQWQCLKMAASYFSAVLTSARFYARRFQALPVEYLHSISKQKGLDLIQKEHKMFSTHASAFILQHRHHSAFLT